MSDSEFVDNQNLMELKEFDSMNHMLFITKLEEGYNIELSGDEIISMEKISDIKNLLVSKNIDPLI